MLVEFAVIAAGLFRIAASIDRLTGRGWQDFRRRLVQLWGIHKPQQARTV